MKSWIARHDTMAFLILTFGMSWPLWLASGALARTPVRSPDIPWLVTQIGVFAPAFAGMVIGACVTSGGTRRAWRLLALVYAPAVALGLWIATRGFLSFLAVDARSTWGMIVLAAWIFACLGAHSSRLIAWPDAPVDRTTSFLWSAGCLIIPTVLFLAAWTMTGGAAAGASNTPAMPVRDLTPLNLLAAFAMNLAYGGALGEEPGWRGAWLPRLLQRHSPFAASLIISFWWALWHAPIDLSQGFGLTGAGSLVMRQIWTVPVSLLFTWVTLRAGGSLLPPMILHATLNAIPDFVLSQPGHYERALFAFFVFLIVIVIAAALADPQLSTRERARTTGNASFP